MRKLHRWIMTVFMVTLSYWVLSGLTLAIYDATDAHQEWAVDGGGAGARTPTVIDNFVLSKASPLAATDIEPMTTAALAGLKNTAPDATINAVELDIVEGVSQVIFSVTENGHPQRLRFDAHDGHLLGRSSQMDTWLDMPPLSLHTTLKNWHRGNVIGASGVLLALLTGAAVFSLAITGAVLYYTLWRRRKSTGRPGFFWSEPATATSINHSNSTALTKPRRSFSLRTLHRWVSIVAAAFLLHLSTTGMILAWSSLQQELTGIPLAPRAGFTAAEVLPLMQDLYSASHKIVPGAPLVSLRLRLLGGQSFGLPLFGGEHGGQLAIRPFTPGYIISYSGSSLGGASWDAHTWIKRLHRGDFIGSFGGRYISITAGLCLLFLLISGIKLYFDLWKRRRRAGHSSLFWN